MLVRTLTRAAGRFTFEPDREIDLASEDAEVLIAAGAVVAVVVPVAEVVEAKIDEPKTDGGTDKPANRAKRRT